MRKLKKARWKGRLWRHSISEIWCAEAFVIGELAEIDHEGLRRVSNSQEFECSL
jgi:hypothetical protein